MSFSYGNRLLTLPQREGARLPLTWDRFFSTFFAMECPYRPTMGLEEDLNDDER